MCPKVQMLENPEVHMRHLRGRGTVQKAADKLRKRKRQVESL